jgi:adenosylcobinamide-phosphate synthase
MTERPLYRRWAERSLMLDTVVIALIAGVILDLLLGDPPWLPHPVRLIGRLAMWGEPRCRQLMANEYLAGGVLAVGIIVLCAGGVGLILWALRQIHPLLAGIAMTYFMFTGLAIRSLAQEARAIWQALRQDDLTGARRQLSRIVGRDTEPLDKPEMVRATVETVAESTVDGILAPLFFATLGGAPGLWAYKAINTLDSMVGHHEAPYTRFGWAAARIDDVANFVPARIGLGMFTLGTWLVGGNAEHCWRIGRRDGRRHPSPNAGISEAAMAGALGVRLGGRNTYDGVENIRPYLGDPIHPLDLSCIPQALRIMYATSACTLVTCVGIRWLVS